MAMAGIYTEPLPFFLFPKEEFNIWTAWAIFVPDMNLLLPLEHLEHTVSFLNELG